MKLAINEAEIMKRKRYSVEQIMVAVQQHIHYLHEMRFSTRNSMRKEICKKCILQIKPDTLYTMAASSAFDMNLLCIGQYRL